MESDLEVEMASSGRRWRRQSLRRAAYREMDVPFGERWRQWRYLSRPAATVALVVVVGAVAFLPSWDISFGPFGGEDDARQYLQTVWQVVAAAVGVSVALIAFVFEAFVGSGERRHGGTLREFAHQTRIMVLFDLAAVSLVLDGLVLAGVGDGAPAGWPGLVASVISCLTLLVLLAVVPRAILRSLDPEELTAMRLRATRELARDAVREQLIGQIAAGEIHEGRRSGLAQGLPGLASGTQINSRKAGVLHDIRRGRLLRALSRLQLDSERTATVVVELEHSVSAGSALLVVPEPLGRWRAWRIRRSFRIRRRAVLASVALDRALDRATQQTVDAVRRSDEAQWRELDELLEFVLLELPRAVTALGQTFDGPVSRPGWFQRGPAQKIFGIFDKAFEEALRHDANGVGGDVLYSPYRVAAAATSLKAPGLVDDAAGFYVRSYRRARAARSLQLGRETVEVLFKLADRVGAYALAYGDDDVPAAVAHQNLVRVLGSVMSMMRFAIEDRDESAVDDALRRLDTMVEHWDIWRDGERGRAQRELLADIAALRFALGSWALHLLAGSTDRERWALWQRIASRLLDRLKSDEMSDAYWRLVDRSERVLGADYDFWFYDEDLGGVQSLDSASKAATALVVGLAMIEEGGAKASFVVDPDHGWRVQEIAATIDRVAQDPERFAPVYGAPVVSLDTGPEAKAEASSLDRVRALIEGAEESARERLEARIRTSDLDPRLVGEFKSLSAKAASEERLVKTLITHLRPDAWSQADGEGWQERGIYRWSGKAFYTGEPGYVGQDMMATQMGRSAGRSELHELVSLFDHIPVAPAPSDLPGELRAAIQRVSACGGVPLVVCSASWRLVQALGVRFRAESEAMATVGVPSSQADKFNGVFHGAPVLDYSDLADRVLVVDLAAVSIEEFPTPGATGVVPAVEGFDAEAAAAVLKNQPERFASIPEGERLKWLQGHVLLSLTIAWRLRRNSKGHTEAFRVPADLLRGG